MPQRSPRHITDVHGQDAAVWQPTAPPNEWPVLSIRAHPTFSFFTAVLHSSQSKCEVMNTYELPHHEQPSGTAGLALTVNA